MPILEELKKTVHDEIVQGVVETIIDTDDLFKILPFRKVNGGALQVVWEDSIPTAQFISPDGQIPKSEGRKLTQFKDGIKVIAKDIDIPNFSTQVEGADSNIMLYGEIKAIARAYKQSIILGDETSNPLTVNGLNKQIERAEREGLQRTVDAAGQRLSLKLLDELLSLMKMGADVIVMNTKAYNEYKEILRQVGHSDSALLQMKNLGRPVLGFDGVPIIKNDYIPVERNTITGDITTTIYACILDETEGVTGLYAGDNAGIQYKYLGEAQDKDAARYRFKWYCGFTVMNPYAIGAIKNVKIG